MVRKELGEKRILGRRHSMKERIEPVLQKKFVVNVKCVTKPNPIGR